MNLKNKILYNLTEKIILKNKKFKGIHKGESCYLFGNAKSLKYYDLSLFNDRISIGCNALSLHKDFSKIGISYYYEGHPFNFYKFFKDPYTSSYRRHILGDLKKQKIRENSDINFFLDVSDYPSTRGKNIFYSHHFGEKFSNYSNCSLDGFFSANQSALSGMIGMAIYFGFNKITLVGCDHLMRPRSSDHFFEYGEMLKIIHPGFVNEEVLVAAQEFVSLEVVTPNSEYKGDLIPHVSYEDLTGKEAVYRENYEIVLDDDLITLSECSYPYLMTKSQFLKNSVL